MNKNELTLKQLLSRNEFLAFTAGDEITTTDLVKKHRSSSTELVSGRQLFGMAERGMRDYRKALAFTTRSVKQCPLYFLFLACFPTQF